MKILFFSLFAVFLLISPAYAADYSEQQDNLRMLDRLDRLERDLTMLQRQVYSGSSGSSTPATAPSSEGSDTAGGTNLARIEARIAEIEEQMRDLTGKVEQAEFVSSKLSEKLDKMAADNEYRFSALEKKSPRKPADDTAETPTDEAPQTTNDDSASEQPAATEEDNGTQGQDSAETNPSHTLGTLPVTEGKKKRTAAAEPKEQPAADVEEDVSTPEGQYKHAFGLVRDGKYEEAEAAFKQFIANNKKSPLTGSAYYWLGETYYAQQVYDKSAIQFLQSYKNFPKGKKAPESLLKLSMSLGKLKKRKEACSALAKLADEFPNSTTAIKQRAKEEGTRLGCK